MSSYLSLITHQQDDPLQFDLTLNSNLLKLKGGLFFEISDS